MPHYDVIVVGGGVMGCASAYHLAKRGRRVLLLEQFAIGHDRGSSHGHSRIFRLAYDAPDYVRLAQAAFPLWRALERDSGTELLLQTGGLDYALPGTPTFDATRATLAALDIEFEQLDHAAIAQRFPQFQLPTDAIGIYQRDSGILDASRCVATLAAEARRHGADVRENEPARQLSAVGAGVEVRTDTATYAADRLVVTAGAWARPLLSQLGLNLPLTVTREQVAFFTPRSADDERGDPDQFAPDRFPIFIHHAAEGPSAYGFPVFGLPGVKVAFHQGGAVIAPESEERVADATINTALHDYLSQWIPGAAGTLLYSQTCRYTNTPDEHFIIDRHPAHSQIVIGSPCSGHGFKFGVLIGAILADLAEHGATEHPIGMFGLGRPALRVGG
ncbi:MAG: N-methyl-L-tryptophan oxidase [Roseiflexaceae bacterium]